MKEINHLASSQSTTRAPLSDGRKTVWGLKWASFAFITDKLSTLVTMAILARILNPADFGLIATALLIVTIADSLRDVGLRDALIWSPGTNGDFADTAFWLNVALGTALTAALLFLAPLLSRAFEAPGLVAVLQVLALSFIVNGFGATHEALQDKYRHFSRRYAIDLAATFVKASISIGFALAGYGVLAVAFGILAAAVVRSAGRWATYFWFPRFHAAMSDVLSLAGYARHILTTKIADVVIERADQIVIVLILGKLQIGYYYIAARIPEILIGSINIVATRVLFPSYVSVSSDPAALKEFFFATIRFTGYVAIPLGVGLALVADLVIQVVFGSQWHQSAAALGILSLCSIGYSLLWSAGDVMKALGRPEFLARIALVQVVSIFPIMIFMVTMFGTIEAAAFGLLVSLVIDSAIRYVVIRRMIDFDAKQFFRNFYGSALAAMSMSAAVFLTRFTMQSEVPVLELGACACVGALVYGGTLWFIEPDHVRSALRAAR